MSVKLLRGDCRDVLKTLPDESVHCVVTSPPYWGLRDYGVDGQIGLESDFNTYIATMVEVFREVRRVLRKDGTLWLNLGDSYAGGGRGGNPEESPHRKQATNTGSVIGVTKNKWPMCGLKPKDLCGIPWRVAFALQADGWWLRQDIIWSKCLSGGTRLYAKTQKGEMPATLKDLVRLAPSTVQLWDGAEWNQVVEWGEVPPTEGRKSKAARRRSAKYRGIELPVEGDIEIVFRTGERVGCTRTHKWPTQRGDICADQLKIGDVVDSVPLPEPANPVRPVGLPDDDTGWFVGMYLAEGSQSEDTLQFSGHAKEVARNDRLKRIAESFHGRSFVHQPSANSLNAMVNGPMLSALIDTYIVGRTAKDKHLHSRCWERSNDFIRGLLQGYLEGDGHQREGGSWKLGFCNNDQLAADLRTIAARLGASVHLRRATAINTATGKSHKCWRGDLRMAQSDRRCPDGEIIAIEQSRARKFWNVSLAEAPHTFALASGICTKNSNPMPESVTDRCTKAHEYVFLMSKSARYYYDAEAIKEPASENTHEGYSANGAKTRLNETEFGVRPSKFDGYRPSERNKRSVWEIATAPFSEAHFATFPPALIEPCIKAGCRPGGTVLDPFGGAGTTGLVADRLQRSAILIELNPEYAAMGRRRIVDDAPLFAEAAE